MHKRGFTLIELLVVIAIIGILSTIVITLLSGARNSSRDASIKQQLVSLKTEMSLALGNVNTFSYCGAANGSSCFSTGLLGCRAGETLFDPDNSVAGNNTTKLNQLYTAAHTASGGTGSTNLRCKAGDGTSTNSSDWAVAVKLPSDTTTWWCVDSNNVSRATTNANPVGASGSAACAP